MLDSNEQGLAILFTSGTTGLPKRALISHRALVARAMAFAAELMLDSRDAFVAWAPMFHMASTDHLRKAPASRDGRHHKRLRARGNQQCVGAAQGWMAGDDAGVIDAFMELRKASLELIKGIKVCGLRRYGRSCAAASDRRADPPAGCSLPELLRRY